MKMKSIIALLAALCLLFCGCAGTGDAQTTSTTAETAAPTNTDTTPTENDAQASILGNWHYEISVEEFFGKYIDAFAAEQEASDPDDIDEDIQASMFVYERLRDQRYVFDISFSEDGTCRIALTDDCVETMTEAARALWPEMLAMRYEMSLEEMEAALAADGLTVDDLIEENKNDLEEATLFWLVYDMENGATSSYILEGDQLTMYDPDGEAEDGIVYTVSITADELTIVEVVSGDSDFPRAGSVLTRAD